MKLNIKQVAGLFINGKFLEQKGRTFDVFNPCTEEPIAKVVDATINEAEQAIKAARTAFDKGPWPRMKPSERAKCMYKLADLIEQNAEELARLESLNNGKPFSVAKKADLPLTVQCYRYYAGWIDKIHSHVFPMDGSYFSYTLKEPVGVAAQIIPWNFPLLMQAWKFGPALAAGCTVVLKTSPNTPLTALKVAELSNEAGFPPGVINIISGHAEVGSYLTSHKDVDKVAFTGSTKVGLEIMKGSHAHRLKRVTLELGGKSANIVTAYADPDKAVDLAMNGLFFNTGQCCIAASRTYVHSSLYATFLDRVMDRVKKIKYGDAFDDSVNLGPLISREQFNRVMSHIANGKSDGAKVCFGGNRGGKKGFFVEPTIFSEVDEKMSIAREEIFGPVMAIMKYDTTEEVIERANSSQYGLGAGVITENADEAIEFSSKLRAGTVYINTYNSFSANAPFGGYKNSGIGRELGEAGLNNYLELKTVIHRTGKR